MSRRPTRPPASIYSTEAVFTSQKPAWPQKTNRDGWDTCPNPDCLYHAITNEQIHALVGCGGHGSHEYIRDLKCQACQTKFSVRYGTVLYRLKTPSRRVGEVLSALAEGLSVGAAVRVFGHGEFTIRTWLTRAGLHATSIARAIIPKSKSPAHSVG